jgi:subtilisin-like proprotein convertase family protein
MSSDVPKGIPDLGLASSQLHVPQSGEILEVTLEFRIPHECVGDLRMTLRHPDGTPYTAEGPGFGGEECAPLWEDALQVPAEGKPSAGNWILEVSDTRPVDAGVLEAWGLRLRIRR